MNHRIYNALIIASSLLGYLQWGDGQWAFLIKMEWDLIKEAFTNPLVFFNPVVLIPMVGQVFLITATIKKRPNKYLTYSGIACVGLLFGLIFYSGFLAHIYWIPLSTLPFFVLSFLTIRYYRKL